MIIALLSLVVVVLPFVESYRVGSLPDDLTNDIFQNDCLTITNMYRARHPGTPPVVTDKNMIPYCKERINALAKCNLNPEDCGGLKLNQHQQNFYWMPPGSKAMPTAKMALDAWYNEISRYNWNKSEAKYRANTAHFTNMIWKAVKNIACCQLANKKNKETMIVCLYTPPGNSFYASAYPWNVLPLPNSTYS